MSGVCEIKWWHAGGLHVHVKHPDGSWERRTWPAHEWWQVDSLVIQMEGLYGKENVSVSP